MLQEAKERRIMPLYAHPNQMANMQTTTTKPPLAGFFWLYKDEAAAVAVAGDDVAVPAEAIDWVVEVVAAAVGEG